jgi:UDP-glucuronate 4-epimerase
MRSLVTGCAGFVGSHLTEALLADGEEVIGVDCFNDNYGRREKLRNLERAMDWDGFEFMPIDLARGDLFELLRECDTVFHLAAEPGVRSSWGDRFEQYLRNNVLATQQLLEAAASSPPVRFVYASSSSIYGEAESSPTPEDAVPRPVSPYGLTKLSAEQLCDLYHLSHGIGVVSLRLFSVYGPRQRPDMAFNAFCRAALEDAPINVFGDGRQTRDFTYVGDVVTGLRRAAEVPGIEGSVFNIGGGSQASVAEALSLIAELAERELRVAHSEAPNGDVRDTCADTTRTREALGFVPRTPLAQGLAAEFEWMRASASSTRRSTASGQSGRSSRNGSVLHRNNEAASNTSTAGGTRPRRA